MAKHNPIKQHCPNCGGEAVREGNEIICVTCDATFTIKKTGAAKVKKIGRLEDLEDRVAGLEAQMTPAEPPAPAKPPAPVEPQEEPEEDIL